MVGQRRAGIILLVVSQSFIYVIPSLLCAFSACLVIL